MTQTFKPVRKAVFPVAGLGTRFLPATKAIPKEMLTVGEAPLIQHAVEEARNAGIEEFIFVTSPSKEALKTHFKKNDELESSLEKKGKTAILEKLRNSNLPDGALKTTFQEQPLGLGHAVWCAKQFIGGEPFAILLPDDVVQHPRGAIAQMMDVYKKHGGNVVATKEVPREQTSSYGIVDPESDDGKIVSIKGLVEKPKPENAPSNLCVVGRYILQPEVFEYLDAFETGAGGEIQLTDSMAKLIGRQPFHGVRFEGGHYDCGSRLGFIEANVAFGLADPEIADAVRKILDNYR
ncbi:MAG: UTP--glucose-1-phosphate uridylyltransferase [Micavibrio aeruginosavorus]|uniref:UTP--glucose-1-phosphate uridylyltransferase n=1 Tax=Micavibrio aeruginosavorus TaxID=349221 RepID=A0A2W5N1M6_9BACT|nr:MAG: UTP--glucose-1-phosphate uridylyltransferase [Micavibrio aeruginosavorus]